MTFTAIDFETATYYRDSACAVGIVTVDNGLIVDEYHTLIQPPNNYYYYNNTNIHGISAKDTINVGTFDVCFAEIQKRLLGKIVVAHNEYFDRSVLNACISYYGLTSKNFLLDKKWVCTLKLYRSLGFYPNRLCDCCERLNIPLQHHEALSDARACAKLYLNYLENHK